MMHCPPAHRAGFTVTELMVALVIVSLLVTLAAPSYLGIHLRAHRTEAIAELLGAASCQERQRSLNGRYDTTLCRPSDDAHYRFAYAALSGVAGAVFRIEALPQGRQARDRCGTLSLHHDGRREADTPPEQYAACWMAR